MLTHDSVTQFLARRDDGSIVGVSTLATFPIPTAIRAWVEDVIVDEASNNQGIGRQLIDAMVERARQLGAKTVDLTSRPSREAANHLYRKAGFELRDTNVYRFTVGLAPLAQIGATLSVMPSIQVKDVPDEVHATLRKRAASAGMSLQEYLLARLVTEAWIPDARRGDRACEPACGRERNPP